MFSIFLAAMLYRSVFLSKPLCFIKNFTNKYWIGKLALFTASSDSEYLVQGKFTSIYKI